MSEEFPLDGNALTDPPQFMSHREFISWFGAEAMTVPGFSDKQLTNYQALRMQLVGTWESNKASAQANGELIKALRKKIKKAKRALK